MADIKIYSVETSNILPGLVQVRYYLVGVNKFDIRHRHIQKLPSLKNKYPILDH